MFETDYSGYPDCRYDTRRALVNILLEQTHTCYLGNRDTRHEWGAGLARTASCVIKAIESFAVRRHDL